MVEKSSLASRAIKRLSKDIGQVEGWSASAIIFGGMVGLRLVDSMRQAKANLIGDDDSSTLTTLWTEKNGIRVTYHTFKNKESGQRIIVRSTQSI